MNRTSVLLCLVVALIASLASTSESKAISEESKERLNKEIDKWAEQFSGRPSDCRISQFLFNGHIQIITSNGTHVKGLSKFYPYCKSHWEEAFQAVEVFVTSDYFYLADPSPSSSSISVTFDRTILYLTHTHCRVTSHGITTLEYDENFRINKWIDWFDAELFKTNLKKCEFPPIDATTTTEEVKVEENAKQEL